MEALISSIPKIELKVYTKYNIYSSQSSVFTFNNYSPSSFSSASPFPLTSIEDSTGCGRILYNYRWSTAIDRGEHRKKNVREKPARGIQVDDALD